LTKGISFKWTSDCENAFKTLKQALLTAPVLGYPNFNKPFILACDASGSAIGYILSQLGDDNNEHVIGYGGRALTNTEQNYSVTEQKLLALVSAVSYFHIYLANSTFDVYTDPKALTWLNSIKHINSRLIRWALKLQEYKFKVLHRPGKRNQHCDALSRRDYQNDNTNNVSSPNKKLFEVTFVYANENVNDIPQQFDSQSFTNVCALENISELQKQCPYFGPIYEFYKNGTLPADKKRAHTIPYESIQYEIINDTLYHFFQPRAKQKTYKNELIKQIALPETLRQDFLLSYHDSKAGGSHLGIKRTYEAIKQKYYFKGMYNFIQNYILSCDICQRVKRNAQAGNAPLQPLPIQDVFARWHMDILAGLPKTKEGYQYTILVTESFSHWAEAFPLKTQET
jgi:hypothetical protein